MFSSFIGLQTDACNLTNLILENGAYAAQENDSTVGVGKMVSACCNNGFVRMGPEAVVCLITGQFSEDRPTCEDIDECRDGRLLTDVSDEELSSFPDYVPVVVDHPLLDKLNQVTCQGRTLLPLPAELCHSTNADCLNSKGSYSCTCRPYYIGNGTHCEVDDIPCEPPSAPANGFIRVNRGRSVDFGCNPGHILIGDDRQTCQRGQWEHDNHVPVRCIDITIRCPQPVAPLHGRIVTFDGNRANDHISVACNDDYDLIGRGIRQCGSNGQWSGRAPRCKPKKTLGDVATDIKRNIIDPFTSYTNSSIMRQASSRSANNPSLGLDIVLAYDRSSSLDVTDFQLVVNFTKQLLSNFGVSYDEGGTRVAALTFSSTAEMAFNYSAGVETEEQVFARLDALTDNIGGATGLKEGLSMVATEIYPTMRAGAKHVLFIFTDGQHNTADPFLVANDLKEKRVEIFAVGVGRQINQTALQQIASVPPASHFFYIESFQDLQTLTGLVNSSEIDYKPCGEAGNVLVAGDNHQANEKAWPWLSVIHRNSSTGWKMMCSGTLLCQQWVLTTSSCFVNIPDAEVIDEKLSTIDLEDSEEIKVTVTLGEYNLSLGEGCEQTIKVDRIVLHGQFDYENIHDYDIALLHLSEPVELNSCARTICLPSETDSPHEPIVVGWGTASGLPQNAHDVPLQFPMPLADQAECREDHARDGFDVTDRMLCAGEGSGTDISCHGDSGSPLMYQRSGDDKWALLGISTKGELCSRLSRHGIFTRIEPGFKTWINNVTDDCFNNHIPTVTILNT